MVSLHITALYYLLAAISTDVAVARRGFSIPDIPTSKEGAIIFGYVVAGIVGLVVLILIMMGIVFLFSICVAHCCGKSNAVSDSEAARTTIPPPNRLT